MEVDMRVFVNMKKLGKRKNSITKVPYELEKQPFTVKELIMETVSVCVRDYNERMENQELLTALSDAEMEDQAESGKISFGVNYGNKKADLQEAQRNALQCFEDGIFRIYLGAEELKKPEDSISLEADSELTFIRLTMLSGRMW